MGFKRAQWHSGLTYRQVCQTCRNEMIYMDDKLDFRPWYPDGFVYCNRCQTPLRHNENYAIDRPAVQNPVPTPGSRRFCTQCGRQARPEDRFCGGCGTKLI